LDNRLKVLLDALNGIAYNDDADIVELHAYRLDDKHDPRVELKIKPR
jgi:Holliday junction resolvase RusA-like endonuclease